MIISLFKNDSHERFLQAFEAAVVSERGGGIDWNPGAGRPNSGSSVGWVATASSVTFILVDAPCADVMVKTARNLEAPRINVYFQEKMFWEFTLYCDDLVRIKFSVAPEEWGDVDPEWYVGTPQDLAEVWSVPVERIERYMVNWEPTEVWSPEVKMMTRSYRLKGQKAYPEDQYGYGQMYQGLDFIRALGGDNPQYGQQFRVHLPPRQRRTERAK